MGKTTFFTGATAAAQTSVAVSPSAHTARGRAFAVRSPRHSSQAYYWTTVWQQRERLAEIDLSIGNVYQPTGVDDLIRWLHEE